MVSDFWCPPQEIPIVTPTDVRPKFENLRFPFGNFEGAPQKSEPLLIQIYHHPRLNTWGYMQKVSQLAVGTGTLNTATTALNQCYYLS